MTDASSGRWPILALEGALVAFAATAVLEAVGMAFGHVPDPSAWLAFATTFAAFLRGPAGGLGCAAFSIAFAVLEGFVGGYVFPHGERWILRTVVVSATLPSLALLVGFLRVQGTHRLARERLARAQAEDAERRYRDLIEGLGAVVWQTDVDRFRVQFVSRRGADVSGYAVADWLDSDRIWHRLIHPDDYDRVLAHRNDAVRRGEPYEIEYRIVTRTGQVLWVRTLVHVERDPDGIPRSLRGVMVDVTERRHAEEILRDNQERYHRLFDHAMDALIVHDEAGLIVDVNESACHMLGYARDELLALRIDDLQEGFDAASAGAAWRALPPGAALTEDVSYRRKDGATFPAEVRVGRLFWGGRFLVVALARDTTERRRIDERLLQAQKMDAVGRLAAGVAHDFNNLLTAIRGHTDLMLGEAPDGPARSDLLAIARATERAATLTRQLLAFSRQQIFNPRILDPNAVVVGLEHMVRHVLGPDVTLVIRLGPTTAVRADPGQLEQVLMNLVTNARDAMPEGGTVTIATSRADLEETASDREPWFRPGAYAVITVADTGHGMDAPTMNRIFEPFFTTRDRGPGAGLGLATAYGIVRQTGGYLIPQSEPGAGTTFRLYLPITKETPAAPDPPRPDRRGQAPGTGSVLIVEDEDAVRTLVARVLTKQGYRVIQAKDGAEALERLAADPDIDLLLTDIVMPRLNGRELARRLRLSNPDLRVLLMSGYTDEETVRGREVPAGTAFLAKPFTPDALLARVREVLDLPG